VCVAVYVAAYVTACVAACVTACVTACVAVCIVVCVAVYVAVCVPVCVAVYVVLYIVVYCSVYCSVCCSVCCFVVAADGDFPQLRAHCNTLQTPQHAATHCTSLQHTATHCNTLQHTTHNTHSQVREALGRVQRLNFTREYVKTAYKELTIPPTANGMYIATSNSIATHCNTL